MLNKKLNFCRKTMLSILSRFRYIIYKRILRNYYSYLLIIKLIIKYNECESLFSILIFKIKEMN